MNSCAVRGWVAFVAVWLGGNVVMMYTASVHTHVPPELEVGGCPEVIDLALPLTLPSVIARTVHVTAKRLDPACEIQWHHMAPEFDFKYYNNFDIKAMVLMNRPEFQKHWDKLLPVERADVWRYLVIYLFGGVYSDVDCFPTAPFQEWADRYGYTVRPEALDLIVGVETPRTAPGEPIRFVQWVFASRQYNPILNRTLAYIDRALQTHPREKTEDVIWRTGPVVWSRAILDTITDACGGEDESGYPLALHAPEELEEHGQLITLPLEGGLFRMLVLPYRAFGIHPHHKNVRKTPETQRLVEHRFAFSWKRSWKIGYG